MASSTGTVYLDEQIKGRKGNIISFGRILVGQRATLASQDLYLRTIKTFVPSGWYGGARMVAGSIGSQSTKLYQRTFVAINGSIGSFGVLDNYVVVNSYRVNTLGSMTVRRAGPQGTAALYIGTQPGSLRASYHAVGR